MNRRRKAFIWIIIAGAVILFMLLAEYGSPHDPLRQNLRRRFAKPGTPNHILGTDNLGRDILSRVLYGARPSLMTGLIAISIGASVGISLGFAAAFQRRTIASIIAICIDTILGFPAALLILLFSVAFGVGWLQVAIAIGFLFVPVFARLVLGTSLRIAKQEYVLAAQIIGGRQLYRLRRHILPNMSSSIIAQCSISFASAILISTSLSFLGIGAQPPIADWGLMLKDARNYLFDAPWLALFPGLALGMTVLFFNWLAHLLQNWHSD